MRRRAIRAAWSLLAAFAVIVAILAALAVANGTVAFESLGDTVALLIAFAAFMVVGALIVAHRPATPWGGCSRPSPCWPSPARRGRSGPATRP